ncbi:hypothetical protein [Vibrio chagasii]|nr:hypothetical protein [Vibrio chagasii]
MASVFDEFLIETPITNPNNVRPEFRPTESPSKYKYQALKDFLFMLQIEPFVGLGLVNLVPDPSEFDIELMRAMMEMARNRGQAEDILCEQDRRLNFRMMTEDLLNSIAMMPREAKMQILISEFGLNEETATQTISELERKAEASPLVMLQKMNAGEGGQLIQAQMGPNYEMALLMAQVTGSVLVTDSGSRWQELTSAQHRNQGIVTYPWGEAFDQLGSLPIDEQFLETFRKSQGHFATARNLLKTADRMVLDDNRNAARLAGQAFDFMGQLGQVIEPLRIDTLKILSPDGGFYDTHVQRLLARSSCQRYDHRVRSIYGIGLPEQLIL